MKIDRLIPLLFVLLLVGLCSIVMLTKSPREAQAQAPAGSFTFGVAGDFNSTSNTDTVLKGAASAGINFFLGVGDLSYDTQGSPAGWGTYAKKLIGSVPFVFIMGNHDASQVDQFASALPNPITSAQGTYGKQYYFDYPLTAPLARFIMISPVDGTKDLAWLKTTIDSGRAAGLKWIIVGMHQPCVSTGQKTCEIGQDTMDALTTNKVDLVLFGHDHNYQRRKQVTCAKANSFDATCLVSPGPDYKKGAGTVMLVVGTGGNSFYTTNTSDSESGYFAALNSDTYGYAKITITANELNESFQKTAGGAFSDVFRISDSNPASTLPSVVPGFIPSGGPVGVIPSFFPLAPCPTCTSPNISPATIEITPMMTSVPAAIISNGPSSPSPAPCTADSSVASDNAKHKHKSHHKKQSGASGNGMDGLLQLLMQFINLLLQLLGGGKMPMPQNPGSGSSSSGDTPCAAVPVVSPGVSPAISPIISPIVSP
jgi:hypothetical protein